MISTEHLRQELMNICVTQTVKEFFLLGNGVVVGALMILLFEDGGAAGRQLHCQSEDARPCGDLPLSQIITPYSE